MALVRTNGEATTVAHVETANPENDVLGNVGCMVSDAFQVASSKNELHARAHQGGFVGHVLEELLENAIAVLIDDIVTFKNLRGHLHVAENECTEALAN